MTVLERTAELRLIVGLYGGVLQRTKHIRCLELTILQLRKGFGEKGELGIDFQHFTAHRIDQRHASCPECGFVIGLNEEWLERITELWCGERERMSIF